MIIFKFKFEQTVFSGSYIVDKIISDGQLSAVSLHRLYRTLFFADQFHLIEYSRPITGDTWKCGKIGPIPIMINSILISLINNVQNKETEFVKNFLTFADTKDNSSYLKTVSSIDMEELAESHIECLDKAISWSIKPISMDDFIKICYGSIWEELDDGHLISYDLIAKHGGASSEQLEFIRLQSENDIF